MVDDVAGRQGARGVSVGTRQGCEDGVAVVLEEVGEVFGKARVGQHFIDGQRGESAGLRVVVVGGEDVLDVGRLLEPELDVVAEEEAVLADGDQVAGDAVVIG